MIFKTIRGIFLKARICYLNNMSISYGDQNLSLHWNTCFLSSFFKIVFFTHFQVLSSRRDYYEDSDTDSDDCDYVTLEEIFRRLFGRRGNSFHFGSHCDHHDGWWYPPGYTSGYSQSYSSRYQSQSENYSQVRILQNLEWCLKDAIKGNIACPSVHVLIF